MFKQLVAADPSLIKKIAAAVNSVSLLKKVRLAMEASGWKFAVDKKRGQIYAIVGNAELTLWLQVSVDEEKEVIQTKIALEHNCPAAARRAIAKWCTLRNWKLTFGFFSCDQDDGEIIFHDGMDVEHVEITPKSIDNLLRRAGKVVCAHYDEIIQCIAYCNK
jgi:hypothetical protein